MKITINGSEQTIKANLVSELIVELQLKSNGIALAINKAILPYKEWATTSLSEGDTVTIIKATQGG